MCKLLAENFSYAGFIGNLFECPPESLKDIIAHKDFYIRKALDTKHAEELAKSIREGEELPPVVICTISELSQKRIINGNHTAYAHLLAQKPVKVLDLGELSFENAFKLQAQLNHQGKILAIKPEDIKHYAQLLYRSYRSEILGKRDRNTAIQKVALILGKTERMVYNYLADLLKQEDEELRKRALELYEQGKTQEEIAKELGLDRTTISKWFSISENLSQVQTTTKKVCIFEIISKFHNLSEPHSNLVKPSLNNLNRDFLSLLNTYYEERAGAKLSDFYDWVKGKGYEVSKEEWDEFRKLVEYALRKGLIMNIRRSEKEIKHGMERELQEISKPAREWIIKSYWEQAGPRMLKEAQAFEKLIREVCEDVEVEDVLAELKKRVDKAGLSHVKINFTLFVAVYEDVISECQARYPVLKIEDIQDRLSVLLEMESKEEIEQELKAEYVGYRIPKNLIEELWKEKTKRVKESLLQRARAIEDYKAFKEWINSLQGLEREMYQELREIKEIEKTLKDKHEREVIERLVEEIKSLKHMDYASLVDSLSEEEKEIAIKHRKDLENAFASLERPRTEEVEKLIEEGLHDEDIISRFRQEGLYLSLQELSKIKHSYLKRKEEEIKRIEEERKRKEEELRKLEEEKARMEEELKRKQESNGIELYGEVIEGQILNGELLDEELNEILREFLEEEDKEEEKGAGLKSLAKAIEKYRQLFIKVKDVLSLLQKNSEEGIRQLMELIPEDKRKSAEKIAGKVIKEMEKEKNKAIKELEKSVEHAGDLLKRIEVSLERRKSKTSNPLAAKLAYRALNMWLEEYRRWTQMELPEREKRRGLKEFIQLFDEYLAKMTAKEFMEVFQRVMQTQFSRLVQGNFKGGIAWLTPADLVQNFAKYIPIALYDRVMEEHERQTRDYIEKLFSEG